MHETAIAESLLNLILAEAAKHKGRPKTAKISCGIFHAVNDDVLTFAFEAIAKGTPCEAMKLEIEHKPIQARCRNCGYVFELELAAPSCPNCGSDFDLLPDEPPVLEQIEFETE